MRVTLIDQDIVVFDGPIFSPASILGQGVTFRLGAAVEVPPATAPGQFAANQWAVSAGSQPGQVVLNISALPSNGGSPITALQYNIGAGWVALTGIDTGPRTLDMASAGASYTFVIRAVNAVGPGAPSAPRSATSGAAAVQTVAPELQDDPTITLNGNSFSSTTGSATGTPAPTAARQWLSNGAVIAGPTGATLDAASRAGQTIRLRVTWTNGVGQPVVGLSNEITIPAAVTTTRGYVLDGDSLTQGYGLTPTYPDMLNQQTGLQATNLGVSGRMLSEMDATWASRSVAGLFSATGRNTLVILGGINDIMNGGATLSSLAASMTSYLQKAKAAGFRVLVATLTPVLNLSAARQAVLNDFNGWIRTNAGSLADGFIDLAVIPELSSPADTVYFSDGLHLTRRGMFQVASAVRQATGVALVSDTTPAAFTFGTVSGATASAAVTSAEVEIFGLTEPAPISVTGGSYSINGGAFTTSAGTIRPFDALRLRVTAASSADTATTATATVGGVSGTFTATTAADQTVYILNEPLNSLTGWTFRAYNSSYTTNTLQPARGSIVDGTLRIQAASGAIYPQGYRTLSGLTPGQTYVIQMEHVERSKPPLPEAYGFALHVLDSASGPTDFIGPNRLQASEQIPEQDYRWEFVATQSTHYLAVQAGAEIPNSFNRFRSLRVYERAAAPARPAIDSVVVIGASLMEFMFGKDLATPNADASTMLANAGHNLPIYGYGTPGYRLSAADEDYTAARTAHPNALIISHYGGNNVSDGRPYPGGQTTFNTGLADLLAAAQGDDRFYPMAITFRDYDDTTFQSPDNGSRPYNENLLIPWMAANFPHAVTSYGRPVFDNYRRVLQDFETWLSADNVHLNSTGYAGFKPWIIARIADVLTGTEPAEIAERVYSAPPVSTLAAEIFPVNEGAGETVTSESGGTVFTKAAGANWRTAPVGLAGTTNRHLRTPALTSMVANDMILGAVVNISAQGNQALLSITSGARRVFNFSLLSTSAIRYLSYAGTSGTSVTSPTGLVAAGTPVLLTAFVTNTTVQIRANGTVVHEGTFSQRNLDVPTDGSVPLVVAGREDTFNPGVFVDPLLGDLITYGFMPAATAADLSAFETRLRDIATAKGVTLPALPSSGTSSSQTVTAGEQQTIDGSGSVTSIS